MPAPTAGLTSYSYVTNLSSRVSCQTTRVRSLPFLYQQACKNFIPPRVASHRTAISVRCTASSSERLDDSNNTALQGRLAMLARVPSFNKVDAPALRQLAEQGSEEDLPAGHKLGREGVAAEACYVLASSGTFLKRNGEGELQLQSCFGC